MTAGPVAPTEGKLPGWWTNGPPVRVGEPPYTYEELVAFYDSEFVREVLGHTGGITTLPELEKEDG